MFKGVEPTKYIQLAYLTGILPIKREKTGMSLFSLSRNPKDFLTKRSMMRRQKSTTV